MSERLERAKYGAVAHVDEVGELPGPFPRTMGPNCMKYLQEVVKSGLTSDMVGRFERAFAEAYGVKHCIATPGCTPALACLAAACRPRLARAHRHALPRSGLRHPLTVWSYGPGADRGAAPR